MGDIAVIDNPRDALVYVDFMTTFTTDPLLSSQWRGIGNVIRALARKVEESALHMERHEAAVEKSGECDIVEVLRGIRVAAMTPKAGESAMLLANVCKQAADEIDRLRWELRCVEAKP